MEEHGETSAPAHLKERAQFQYLLLQNPNYFGNLEGSPAAATLDIKGNTSYEEIGCVGYQPQFSRLEAVVFVKQFVGYGGGLCGQGSTEYVRFYLSADGGKSWDDLGLTSFTAWDVSAKDRREQRLEYATSLVIEPQRRWCFEDNTVMVRAILSWNAPPPANQPNYQPVWGHHHDTFIQIEPRRRIIFKELSEQYKLAPLLPAPLLASLEHSQVETATPPSPSLTELVRRYGQDIPPHRVALHELMALQASPALQEIGALNPLSGLGLDLSGLPGLLETQGDTRYEALECVGYNAEAGHLAATLRVKLSNGYSGGPCEKGSTEYVAFYADLDRNGSFETYLGTTSVTVHDIAKLPRGGLEYAAFLPVRLERYRLPCQKGPRLIPIRAILSWQVAPPPNMPNFRPIWGNHEDTLILLRPRQGKVPDGHAPVIQSVGGMALSSIDGAGLAHGPTLAGRIATDSPFGGLVIVTGHIASPPDISMGAAKLQYRVEVSSDNWVTSSAITDNLNQFSLPIDQLLNGVWSSLPPVNQHDVGGGWYDYQEDLSGGPGNALFYPTGNVLAHWNTGGLEGLWQMRVRVRQPGVLTEWSSSSVSVLLDNTAPNTSIGITSGGGSCADFTVGTVISGSYSATDLHFGGLSLSLLPANGGHFTSPAPTSGGTMPLNRSYPVVSTFGESGTWTLDTTGLPRCGYVLRIDASDRTIVNSDSTGSVGYSSSAVVGLCLRESGQ